MKRSQRQPSIFLNIILFMGLVVVWIAFAPLKIGGRASYVMVNGISMEPGYHTGDLVIVRKAQTYQVGDVVNYRDAEMGAYVIHRIIGIEQGQFVLKGDNNSWIDAYRPTHEEIVGKQWIHAPKAGGVMLWLRTPLNLSLAIVLLGGVLMTSMITKSPQGQKGKNHPSFTLNSGGALEGALYALGFLFLGFLGLSIFTFTRPMTIAADNIAYVQDSAYVYSATGAAGVYDTEMVRAGEPVFTRLTCFLNIGFTYNILGGQLQNAAGSHQMYARIMDEQSGWQRTIQLIPQTPFVGGSYSTQSTLDICQMEALVNLVEKETGLRANVYTVEIISNIAITANTSEQIITDTFEPALVFKFDKVHLYLANTDAETDPMHITKQGLAGGSILKANTISILGWELSVGLMRVAAIFGLVTSLGGLGILGWLVFDATRQSEEALIRLRYGSLLMDVGEQSLNVNLPVIDVKSINDLAKMAERQNAMILHATLDFLHCYLVQSNGAMYRYVLGAGKNGIILKRESIEQEIFGRIANGDEYIVEDPRPMQREAARYVINIENVNITNAPSEETAMLGRIKI